MGYKLDKTLKDNKKSIIIIAVLIIVIVLVTIFCISLILLGFWKFNIQKNNQNENWDMDKISFQNIIDILKGKEPEGKEGFTNSYFKSIFTRSTITERNLTIFAATLLIMAINIYVYNNNCIR